MRSIRLEHQRAQIGPIIIHYQVGGAGPPVVLIHGLSGSWRWWDRNIDALARHFRLYLVDLAGFGASHNRQPFVLREAASYLDRLMGQLGIARAHVIGHSMGGAIAAALAADFAARVDRLVLVDAAIIPLAPRYRQQLRNLAREARQTDLAFMPILVTDALRAGLLTLWRATNDLLANDPRQQLARIHAPTLVIWGENDALVPPATGEQLSRLLRYDRFEVIKGAGHNAMWDRPAEFNQLVIGFLQSEKVSVES